MILADDAFVAAGVTVDVPDDAPEGALAIVRETLVAALASDTWRGLSSVKGIIAGVLFQLERTS